MSLKILGAPPFEKDAKGQLKSRIATIFPRHGVLVTVPGTHASQRLRFLEELNKQRMASNLPPLSKDEEAMECSTSVDLFIEPDAILIRPDPNHMALAFEADLKLQEFLSKRRIRFLFVWDEKVRQAIKRRGECWRISAFPKTRDELEKLIAEAKVAIGGNPIYYYNHATGTRYVTYQEFAGLEHLPPQALAAHLQEIASHALRRNRLGNPEVDFFCASPTFSGLDFAGIDFKSLSKDELMNKYRDLKERFKAAVDPGCRTDNLKDDLWRQKMAKALLSDQSGTVTEEVLRGLSPEFFLQIEWLPGGYIEEGEFMFDSIFDEAAANPDDPELRLLCDHLAHGFIFNFIREYGDLEYVNVGRVGTSLSVNRPLSGGRRGVYIVELKLRDTQERLVRFIRLQKWGIRERLEEKKDLLRSIIESEEYTDYVLDRRLGCRQLGMKLPSRVTMRRTREKYTGSREEFNGTSIWVTYFERDYVRGIATDKIPAHKYDDPTYSLKVAKLLGKAAASNLIVGRAHDDKAMVIFDDGDEVIIEDDAGLPKDLIVTDPSGAFADYRTPLVELARHYATPVNIRVDRVPNANAFAQAYLNAFHDWFVHVQHDYRKRQRAFDMLFKHLRYDPAGSFAYRWECVLKRLNETNPIDLVKAIQEHLVPSTSSEAPH
ncbi:MAG: hypothetical protein QHJ82_10010 [Verrucomicrobiota bacterium]|nr:hypothetical protein [Verrucomicrobiota bacterium]